MPGLEGVILGLNSERLLQLKGSLVISISFLPRFTDEKIKARGEVT